LSEAIAHINSYGSGHTDAIATEDSTAAATFLAQVNAAGCTTAQLAFLMASATGLGQKSD